MIKLLIREIRELFTFKGLLVILYGLPVAIFIRIINKSTNLTTRDS